MALTEEQKHESEKWIQYLSEHLDEKFKGDPVAESFIAEMRRRGLTDDEITEELYYW
jgi:transcription initiation factor IIE alpha subunit